MTAPKYKLYFKLITDTPYLTLPGKHQNINYTSNSQQTPHTLPSRLSYGVCIMRILNKVDYDGYIDIDNTVLYC